MLTDDDLTRELGAAFRAETETLTYAGRRRPRRAGVALLPVAAVGVAVAAVAANAALSGPAPAPSPVAGPSPSTTAAPALVSDSIKLAGYTLTYQREAGRTAPIYAQLIPGGLPDSVTPVPLEDTDAKAWIGKDPSTGDNALYVKAPTRTGGQLFALMSSVWTQDELVDLFKHGSPRTVPLIKR